MAIGHVVPEAVEGGPIALIKDGDTITIDAGKRLLDLDVSESELAERKRWVWRGDIGQVLEECEGCESRMYH
jgi:dihydroxy-acid dehydratase